MAIGWPEKVDTVSQRYWSMKAAIPLLTTTAPEGMAELDMPLAVLIISGSTP
ncbi:hypothetical protein D3C73_1435130 [compost metagenome]